MIFGIGTDIAEVKRFRKWVENPGLLRRFFNEKEILQDNDPESNKVLEHYASRFSSKEAFVKALGTGFSDFELKEIFVTENSEGKPFINVTGNAEKLVKDRCGDCFFHLSLSHEKEYTVAFVIIEK